MSHLAFGCLAWSLLFVSSQNCQDQDFICVITDSEWRGRWVERCRGEIHIVSTLWLSIREYVMLPSRSGSVNWNNYCWGPAVCAILACFGSLKFCFRLNLAWSCGLTAFSSSGVTWKSWSALQGFSFIQKSVHSALWTKVQKVRMTGRFASKWTDCWLKVQDQCRLVSLLSQIK